MHQSVTAHIDHTIHVFILENKYNIIMVLSQSVSRNIEGFYERVERVSPMPHEQTKFNKLLISKCVAINGNMIRWMDRSLRCAFTECM